MDRESFKSEKSRRTEMGSYGFSVWMDCITLSRMEHAHGIGQVPFAVWIS